MFTFKTLSTVGGGLVAMLGGTTMLAQATSAAGTDFTTQVGILGIAGGLGGVLVGLAKVIQDTLKDKREQQIRQQAQQEEATTQRLRLEHDHEARMEQLRLDADCRRLFGELAEWIEEACKRVPTLPSPPDLDRIGRPEPATTTVAGNVIAPVPVPVPVARSSDKQPRPTDDAP